ncbi:putative DNA-binding transcriptional regulator YafY [Leucobacter luti]|uniref:helix-turn-helix transcriptional regulator n=1 Tax=Leucobacter luti TaxID=340320 RepID=UPI0010439B27|nr:YafY family protein [Leucobacter luti]MCW2289032.1 putative DNA-binding transcriptional regulator YafY [Leucobacter luti]TCK44824.1 putative DNA-binding transcriptional regulator YafY [Leucobacter luti]
MKSDRLVAILLMLQRREQVTAAEVAKELEVSERTARRDLDALGMAGIPIYSIQGRSGGWRLLGGGRTDLSGLTASEARALFQAAGPTAAAQGASSDVKAALRKLVRALPETFRTQAEAAAASLIVDSQPWGGDGSVSAPPPFLDILQDAVIRGVQAQLRYVDSAGKESERRVHPLGLVVKGARWYLVAHTETGRRTFRLDRVISVVPSDAPVHRGDDFDLTQSWRDLTAEAERRRGVVEVHAKCAPEGLSFLQTAVGDNLEIGPVAGDGRIPVVIRAPSEYGIAGHLAGLVEWLEITSPQAVRTHLAMIGAALTTRYTEPAGETRSEAGLAPSPHFGPLNGAEPEP